MALLNRPRLRWLVDLVGEGSNPPPPVQAPAPAPAPVVPDLGRDTHPGALAMERESVTNLLYERLSEEDRREVLDRIMAEENPRAIYEDAQGEALHRFLVLSYGVWFGVPAVLEKTGLTADQPPEEVHAMARGPLAAAGGLYEADMVVDGLASAGVPMSGVRDALDFGCSSGRVLRVMRVAFPETSWRGCDPNEPAVQWTRDNLPGIEFFVSGNEPPLELADESLDLVYAISIWSHFEPELGLRWFEEMHRVLRPGGHLVFTTHGLWTIAHDADRGLRPDEQSLEIARALYREGTWYHAEFGEEGDWGVVNPLWGTAFLSPEWILAQLCPRWRVVEFASGRNQGNQDLYVLARA